jgi:hypothetical protein
MNENGLTTFLKVSSATLANQLYLTYMAISSPYHYVDQIAIKPTDAFNETIVGYVRDENNLAVGFQYLQVNNTN